ncbi:MAG: hypothetical protein ACXWP4_13895 [Polyangiales bacterium]
MTKRALVAIVAAALAAPDLACSKALPPLPPPNPRECMRSDGQSRLLLIGEQGAVLAHEIATRRDAGQLIAIQLDGCEIRVIKDCAPRHEPYYVAYNPVQKETHIRSEAELFANVASVDEKLRRHLGNAHELTVRTVTTGRWDWAIDEADVNALHLYAPPPDQALAAAGEKKSIHSTFAACKAATHVVTMMTTGSFALYAEGRPAAADRFGKTPEVQTIEEVGDPAACGAARPGDTAPPKRCGEGFAIEILPIGGKKKLEPTCAGHTTWTGTQCADACGVGFKPEHCSS